MNSVFGARIKQARQIRGLSTERFAELIRRTPREVIRYETDLEQPLVETLERIAIVLSWPIGFFRQKPPPWDFPEGSLLFHEIADAKRNRTNLTIKK